MASASSLRSPACRCYSRPVRRRRLSGMWGMWGLAGVAVILASGGTAHGGYTLCNETSYVLESALATVRNGKTRSRGWFQLFPGACRVILADPLQTGEAEEASLYYVYARTSDVYRGPARQFLGKRNFCIDRDEFDIEGAHNCRARGFGDALFRAVEVGGDDWTTSFSEPEGYSLLRAKIAGVQRLLSESDGSVRQVDGFRGRYTSRAIRNFQRDHGLPADSEITDALFEALLVDIREARRGDGLTLCNQTDRLVWSAVGIDGKETFLTRGWLRIEPGACLKAVRDALGKEDYYIFAEAVDGNGRLTRIDDAPLAWGGEHPLCVKSTRFIIRGQADCLARGFERKHFRAVDTNGKPGATVVFSRQNRGQALP